ncbi:MAG: protein-export chaperone SecB [Gammaproteobacteria bacterium]|nr:protein-export chaperone SecB [Gammaproteobacteria bacterium]
MAEQENSTENLAASTQDAMPATTFDIRKIYLKDASVESPNSPDIFLTNNNQPEVKIDASIKAAKLEQEDYYEVSLGVTVTSSMAEQTAFLVEVHQAGVFHIVGIPLEDMPLALEIACPNVLLPFAREAISDLVGKAGFPQLILSPINFESLYQQKVQQRQQQQETAEPAAH